MWTCFSRLFQGRPLPIHHIKASCLFHLSPQLSAPPRQDHSSVEVTHTSPGKNVERRLTQTSWPRLGTSSSATGFATQTHTFAKLPGLIFNIYVEICLILFFVIPNNMYVYVYIYDRSIPVYWGTYSIVEAELACLADLLAVPGWRYAVNLAGSEVVLATNRSRTFFWGYFKSEQGAGDGPNVRTKLRHLHHKSTTASIRAVEDRKQVFTCRRPSRL